MDFDEVEISPAIEEKLWIKHRVTVEEVEEALLNPHIEKRKPGSRKRRYVYGRTESGRYLFMVVEHIALRRFFLLTAMDMDQGERKKYGRQLKKTS
ncbi:MAG: BrnT family toxin [Candidatus Binatia bacterium]